MACVDLHTTVNMFEVLCTVLCGSHTLSIELCLHTRMGMSCVREKYSLQGNWLVVSSYVHVRECEHEMKNRCM